MRGRSLSIGTVGRAAGFVVVAAAIIAASIHLRHAETSASAPAGTAATSGRTGPLAPELARCRSDRHGREGRRGLRSRLGREPAPVLQLPPAVRSGGVRARHGPAGGSRAAGQVAAMGGTGVIDRFLGVFTQYIDSGFGLVEGDVRWLAGVLIAIDITLAGLFWAMAPDEDVIARLIRKTLYIGVFAFIIGNFNTLAQIVFSSFAGLGLEAGGGTLSQAQLLQPGRLAQVGIDAGKPILDSISGLMGFVSFFDNFIQIAILLIAWLIVVISFFIMAIQLFVSLIEFKLTTLAGFVLVPFGLFGRTAFLAEKVLGNVVSSGVKVLVLAVIVGIGSTIFSQFTSGFNDPPTIEDALTLILAALALLGLSIFGPGIANGLIAGGPQLGAGAAVGTGLAVAGAGAAAVMGAGAAGGALAGAARGGAAVAGGAVGAYRAGAAGTGGAAGVAAGAANAARAAASAAVSPLRRAAESLKERFDAGGRAGAGGSAAPECTAGGDGERAGLGDPDAPAAGGVARHLHRRLYGPCRRSPQRRNRRRSLRGIGPRTCPSSDPPCATAQRPNPRHPISGPARPGTSASARPASRRRTGGSPSSACSCSAVALPAASSGSRRAAR